MIDWSHKYRNYILVLLLICLFILWISTVTFGIRFYIPTFAEYLYNK